MREVKRISSTLIERAMELRAIAYLSNVKHRLLMETILNIENSRRSVAKGNMKLQEVERIKNLFLAGVSHEMNNPLSAIIGYSKLVAEGRAGPLTEKQNQYLNNVLLSAEHLKTVVSDVLDIAKLDSNVIQGKVEKFRLTQAVDEALIIVQQDATAKGIKLSLLCDADAELCSDKQRVVQCLVNLLSNGIKYTNEGEVNLSASIQNGMVEFSVRDTGVGLSEEDLVSLFEVFERGVSASRTNAAGNGIGLFLTHKLVNEVLKGTITVSSKLDEGSTFTIRIPQTIET